MRSRNLRTILLTCLLVTSSLTSFAASLTLTSPLDYHVVQRNAADKGLVIVAGVLGNNIKASADVSFDRTIAPCFQMTGLGKALNI